MFPTRKPTVLIADDHTLIAESIAVLVSTEYEVVGISSNGRRLVADALRLRPDLIVLDITMPELNGIEAAQQLADSLLSMRLVFITQHTAPDYLCAALRAGALGYVAKQSAYDELHTALHEALAGRTYVFPALRELTAFAPVAELRRTRSKTGTLTKRQREILYLLAQGKTARDMSAALNISSKTIEFHKKALMDHTGLHTTAELTRYALSNHHPSLSRPSSYECER